jgi:hypothetical protein
MNAQKSIPQIQKEISEAVDRTCVELQDSPKSKLAQLYTLGIVVGTLTERSTTPEQKEQVSDWGEAQRRKLID